MINQNPEISIILANALPTITALFLLFTIIPLINAVSKEIFSYNGIWCKYRKYKEDFESIGWISCIVFAIVLIKFM